MHAMMQKTVVYTLGRLAKMVHIKRLVAILFILKVTVFTVRCESSLCRNNGSYNMQNQRVQPGFIL